MRIIISQQDKKISVEFYHPNPLLTKEGSKGRLVVDKFVIAKSEEFLNVVDKFIRKRKISPIGQMGRIGPIEFHNVGLLTERTIRAIMLGLSINKF